MPSVLRKVLGKSIVSSAAPSSRERVTSRLEEAAIWRSSIQCRPSFRRRPRGRTVQPTPLRVAPVRRAAAS